MNKKFRNIIETPFEDLFEDEKIKAHLEKNLKVKEFNKFITFIFNNKFLVMLLGSIAILLIFLVIGLVFSSSISIYLLLALGSVFSIGFSIFFILIVKKIITARIQKEIKTSIDQIDVFKLTLDNIENIDVYDYKYANGLDDYIWKYSNFLSFSHTTINIAKEETSIIYDSSLRLHKISKVLRGIINGKKFSLGIATWSYEVEHGRSQDGRKNSRIEYVHYGILKIVDNDVYLNSRTLVNDSQTAKVFKMQKDKLENKGFNNKFDVYANSRIDSRKIFTLYNQELWLKLWNNPNMKQTKIALDKNIYVQAIHGKAFNPDLFEIDLKKLKKLDKKSIIEAIFLDVKNDLKNILWLISFFSTIKVLNK